MEIQERIIIFGTGTAAFHTIKSMEGITAEVVAFADNDSQKWGGFIPVGSKSIPVVSPETLREIAYDRIVIGSTAYEEIYRQLNETLKIPEERIENRFYFHKQKILINYRDTQDHDIKEILGYLKNHELSVFNYPFTEAYKAMEIPVYLDEINGLYYVFHCGKRMYMNRKYKDKKAVADYYRGLLAEQDENSPHCYCRERFYVEEGDVVVDAGVAEGNFALSCIDKVKRIYLVESDRDWIEALKYTFSDYTDKVVFVNKYLGNITDGQNVTLDAILHGKTVDFIKMDIEGAECAALEGAAETLSGNCGLKLAVCAYHNEEDEENITELLYKFQYNVRHSNGYMVFIQGSNYFDPRLKKCVRGLLYAEKMEKENAPNSKQEGV